MFYEQLQRTINETPNQDILILMGDFNAKVGQDHHNWPDVIGKFGYGDMNQRGENLLSFCAKNDLYITNTNLKHKANRKWK